MSGVKAIRSPVIIWSASARKILPTKAGSKSWRKPAEWIRLNSELTSQNSHKKGELVLKNNTLKLSFAAVASLLVLWAGLRATAQHSETPEITKATAVLNPTEGNNIRGVVTFTQVGANVKVVAHIEGLTPGKHGFHIHEFDIGADLGEGH